MNKSFMQTDKTMNDKAEISRVPLRARAHAPFDWACSPNLKTLLLNAAVVIAILLGLGAGNVAWGQVTELDPTTDAQQIKTTGKYKAPAGYRIMKIECWGGGGSGQRNSNNGGRGGGGGGYASVDYLCLATDAVIDVTALGGGGAAISSNGNGNSGTDAWVKLKEGSTYVDLVKATGGLAGGAGGTGGTGWVKSGYYGKTFSGGTGGSTYNAGHCGGGGGGAGNDGNGNDGEDASGGLFGIGAQRGDGGAGGESNGGVGGGGQGSPRPVEDGGDRSGGGGGSGSSASGKGGDGGVWVTLAKIHNPELQAITTAQEVKYSGDYYAPLGYRIATIECWGGGGSGSHGGNNGGYGGGGGGYYGYNVKNIPTGESNGKIYISIGDGGASVTSTNTAGNQGSNTTVSYPATGTAAFTITANGGKGGKTSGGGEGGKGGKWEGQTSYQNGALTGQNGGTGGSRNGSRSGGGATAAFSNSNGSNGNNATSSNNGARKTVNNNNNPGSDRGYGGAGANGNNNAEAGGLYGGGGGGSQNGNSGMGAPGFVRITLAACSVKVYFYANDDNSETKATWTYENSTNHKIVEDTPIPVLYTQQFRNQSILHGSSTDYMDNSIERDGYEFEGWYTAAEGGSPVDVDDYLNQDPVKSAIEWGTTEGTLKLYAHWTPKEYHFYVNLDKNFDSDVDDFEDNAADDNENIPASGTTCGDKFTLPHSESHYYFVVKYDDLLNGVVGDCIEEIHRNGYQQDGWFWSYDATDREFDNQIDWTKTWNKTDFPNYAFNNNTFTDIYLRWKPATYNVTLKANTYNSQAHFADQQTDTIIKVDYNRPYGTTLGDVLPTTSESGFIFRGWSTVEDTTTATGTTVNADSIFKNHSTTNPTKLYAKWERKIEFTVDSTDVLCHGGSTGEIHVTNIQYGNGSSYTVSISGPTEKDDVITTDGTADFTGLKAGSYTVTVKDANHQGDNEDCTTSKVKSVGEPDVLHVSLVGHNPNCDTLNGSVEVKITGGVKNYTGNWKASNESGTHTLTIINGDSAVFEQFVEAERTYTVSVTDKNNCPAMAETTLQPRANPFHFDYPVYKLNVCSGSKFSVNPTDFPLNPNDQPLHTTTETKNSAPAGTRYSWSVPTCSNSSLSVDDFNGEEGHSETDVNGRIVNTTEYVVTVTYTVTPTNGYYCIGDPFTVTVEVNPGDNTNIVELSQTEDVDSLCVGGGSVSVTVKNAANNSTLTWVLEDGTESGDTVQVDVLENPSNEVTKSYTVHGITGCSADSVYMVYYNDASGCTSELRKTVHLEIEKWNMNEYSDLANAKYISNAATVNCVTQVIRPTANMLPPIAGANAVTAGCGLETDTSFISRSPEELNCDGTYIYTYHYKVKSCPSNYQVWTYTYTVNKENVSPTIELKSDELDTVNAIITTYCGYRIPKLTGSDTVKVSDAENCTSNPNVWQEPAALTLITDTTEVKVIVMDACGMSDTVIVTVTVPDSLKFPELTSTGVTCYGKGNGTIKPKTITNTTATGGTPDYLYYIDGNFTNTYDNLEFSSLSGGNHMVSVKDANGCEASTVVTVEEPSPLTATVSVTDVDCNGNSTGQITIVASGGTPGTDEEENHLYWYKLGESGAYPNDGRVDSVFKEKAAGTYKVYAKDDNGCEIDKTVTIGQPLRPLTLVVSPADAVCYGNTTSVFVSANGGNGGYEYKWYTTSVETPVSTSALYSIDPAPEETTTYNILVTDAKGCKETSSVEVTVNPLVQLEILSNQTQSVCLNNAINPVKIRTNVTTENLIANGLPMYVDVHVLTNENNEKDTVISGTPIVSGTYQYTVWGISQYGCPPETVNGSLVVHSAFTPGSITGGEHAICYGAELPAISSTEPALGGDGQMHYKWQYSTEYNADNEPIWNDIANVDAADLASTSIPAGSNLQTTSFRRWAKNDCSPYVDDEDITVDEDGWVLSSGVYTLKVNKLVAVAITGSDNVCIQGSLSGDVLELGMTLGSGDETVNTEDYTYSWTLGNNEGGVPVGSSTGTTFNVSWTSPTTELNPKHVYLDVTETATTCVSHAEKTVTVNQPELTLNNISVFNVTKNENSNGTICKDESVKLTANTTAVEDNTNYYTWKVGETVVKNASTEAFYVVTPTATTTYTVEVYAVKTVNNVSCTTAVQTREVTITVNDPQVTINNINIYSHIGNTDELLTDNVVCYGTTVKLMADTSGVVGTPTIKWEYWKPSNDPNVVPDPTEEYSHPLWRNNLTDTTKFRLTVTATVGACPKVATMDTTVNVRDAFDAGTISGGTTVTKEVCYGTSDETLNLTPITYTEAEGGEAPREYRWIHTYNNISDTTAVSQSPSFTFAGNYGNKAGVHTFIREAKDAECNDWEQSVGSYVLTVYPQFKGGAISTIGQTICYGDDVNLIGSVTEASGGHGPITYTWYHRKNNETEAELIQGAESATFDPSAYNQEPGVHYFTRKAANETCTVTASSTGVYVLNVNPVLELIIEGTTTICASGSKENNLLTLSETNGNTDSYTYLWTTGSNEGATIVSGQSGTDVKASWPNAGEGHITLTVSNNLTNCVSSRTITVTVNAAPDPVISGNESVCQNSDNFPTAVKLTATPAGLSNYEWIADGGGTYTLGETADTANVSWTTVGSHHVSVTVTDGNGCSAQKTKEIVVNALPTLGPNAVQTTSVSCNGGDNGTITATATNGLAPYTYTLDGAQSNTTGLFEGLSASTVPHHTIVVEDANGCQTKKTGVAIQQSAEFTVIIDSIHPTSCDGHDGWIWAQVQGSGLFHMQVFDASDNPVGAVQHHYSGEQFVGTGLSYGVTYTLKVTADGDPNCFDTKQFFMDKDDTLRINSIPQPPVLCSGEENSFDVQPVVNITEGTTLYTWAAPDVNPTNGIQNVNAHHNEGQTSVHDAGLINTTTGNVQLTYHVVATNGVCQTTGDLIMEVGVTVQPPVTINLGDQPRNVCPEERELTLSAEFGGVVNDETTVTWTFANMGARTHTDVVTTSNNSDTAMIALPNVYNTSYHYTVEFTDGVCTKSEGGDVFVPGKLEMVVDEITNVTCYGGNNGSAVVHAVGGTADYVYSMNGETSALLPGGTSYTFENLPVPTQPRDSTDEWGATKCGDYSIRIKDSKGCIVDTMITICSPAQLEWLNCPEMKVFCCDEGQNYATVVPGNAFTIPTLSTMANVEEITINKAGNNRYTARTNPYTISYVVEDVCNDWEEVICEFKFKVLPNPVLSFDNGDLASQSVCFGNPIQNIQLTFANATISATNLPQGVTLDETTGLISGTPSEPLTTPKTYEFTITASSNQTDAGEGGCGTQTLTGSITVNPTPTISLESTQESCSGNDGTITATITSGTLVPLVRVALDEGTHASWLTDNDKVYNQLQAGTHTVTVWSYDGVTEGCSATATIDVPLNSPYNGYNNTTPYVFSPITNLNICSGSSFTATPTAPSFGDYTTTYQWSAPTGNVTGGAASTEAQENVTGTLSNTTNTVQEAVYTVTPTTGDVCEGAAFTVTVPVNPTVVMNRPASQTVCSDSTIAAIAFGTTLTGGTMSYSWSRDNTDNITGLAASGTDVTSIAATALKNTTTEVQTTTITVTPTYTTTNTNGTVSCTGDTVQFTITVNPEVTLAVNHDKDTVTYGQAIDPVVVSYSHSDLSCNIPDGLGLTYDPATKMLTGTPTSAGDHIVTFTASSPQTLGCGQKVVEVKIHVDKAVVNVKADAKTKVYGETDPTLTATVTGLQNGDQASVITYSVDREAGQNVGEYVITPSGAAEQGNYKVTYDTAKFTITRAAVLVNADAQTKTYGAADPTLTATVTGLQNGEAASVITYTLSRVAGENVGEYVITPVGAAVQGNYTVTYDTAKFTITRANVTVKADNKTKPFGTADPTLTATVSGLVNGDAENVITYTLSREGANTTAGENAGTYTITPSGAAVQGNYNVTYETGTLTITPINITVTVTGNTAVKIWTGEEQSVTGYTLAASNGNYDVSHVVFTGAISDSTAKGAGSQDGDAIYQMSLNQNQFSNNDPNYNVTFTTENGWLRIVPDGTVIVNITGHTATTNYDAQPHSVSGYDVEIVAPSDISYTTSDFTFNGQAALNKTNAGVYPMGLAAPQFVNTKSSVNNVIFNVTDGKLTINKVNAVVTITGNHDERPYDGSAHTIADYVVSGVDPTFYTESDFTFNGTATASRTDAGTTYMGLADNQFTNTNANFENVTFHVTDGYQTIQPIEVAVTVNGHTYAHEYIAQEQSVSGYDMVSNSALFNEADVVFSGYAVAAGTNPDTIYMNLTAGQFSYNNPNLDVTFTVNDGWLVIVPAGIVIVNITGHTDTTDYNCAEQQVTGYGVEIGGVTEDGGSFVGLYPENQTDIKFTGSDTAKGTDANIYMMGLTADQFENTNENFDVRFYVTDGSLTIKKVNATVTITGETEEVTYNGQPHTVTGYTVSNATPTCYNTSYIHFTGSVADSTATRTDVGTTDMNLVPGLFQNTNPNFEVVTFNVVNGKMTVNKASMDITVNGSNASRFYTGSLQTYIGAAQATSSSTVFDAAKFGYSGGTTVSGTAVGNYTMALTAGFCSYNDANYNVNWTIGDPVKLTIKKAKITLDCPNVNDLTKVYDGSELHPAATAHGVYAQDDNNIKIEYSTDGSTWSTTVPGITNAGSLHVYVRASNVNYDTMTCDYTLSVTRKAVTITANDANKTYDGTALTEGGFSATDLEEGDTHTFAVAMTQASTITNAGTQPNVIAMVDNVPVTPGVATTVGNYTVTTVNGTLTVTKASITPTCPSGNALTQVYNGSELHPAATASGVNNDAIKIEYSKDGGNTWSETVAGITNVSTQAVNVRASNANYDTAYCEYTLTVSPKEVTITAADSSKPYDGTALTQSRFTASALESGDPHTFVVAMTSASTITDFGTQPNVIATVDNVPVTTGVPTTVGNYTVTTVNGTLTITKAEITLTCPSGNALTQVYNGSELHPAATAMGVNNDVIKIEYSTNEGESWSTDVPGITNASTQVVDVRASNANYDTAYCDYTLTVSPKEVTITAADSSKPYDGTALTQSRFTASALGSGDPHTFVVAMTQASTITNAGTQPNVIATVDNVPVTTGEPTTVGNYTVTTVNGTLTITKAEITLTCPTGDALTQVYNGSELHPAATASGVGNDVIKIEYSKDGGNTWSETVAGITNVSTQAVKVRASNANYDTARCEYTLEITQASMAITVDGSSTEKVYTGSEQSYIGTVTPTSSHAAFDPSKFSYAGSTTATGTDVGDHTTALVEGNCNYNDNNYAVTWTMGDPVKLTITKAQITLACPSGTALTQVYNGSELHPAATASGLGSDVIKIEYSKDGGNTWSETVPGITDVCTLNVKVRASNVNYDTAYCEYKLEITKASMAITVNGSSTIMEYTGVAQTYNGTVTPTSSTTGFVASKFNYTGSKTATGTEVGTYTTALVADNCVYDDNNYAVTWTIGNPVKLTISKALITLTCPTGDALTQVYNGSELHPAATASGLGSDVIKIEYSKDGGNTWSETVAGITNVGTQAVKVRASNANYDTARCEYTLEITQAPMAITVNGSSTEKVYTGSEQSYTGTVTPTSSHAAFDPTKFSYAGSTTATGTNVGDHTTALVEGNCNYNDNNYAVTWTMGDPVKLTITKATLTITANDQTYPYNGEAQGENNATYPNANKVTVEGLQGNDALTSITLNGRETNAAVYTGKIVPSAAEIGEATGNYEIAYVAGKLTINPADLTIIINANKVYDGGPLVREYNGVGVSISGNVSGAHLTAGKVTTDGVNVGTYTSAASTVIINTPFAMSDDIDNYNVSYNITMKITEDVVVMTCPTAQSDTEKVYDGSSISYTVTATAGSNSATVEYSLDNNAWSQTVPTLTDAGTKLVYVRASAANYATQYCQYTLKVTPKPVEITVADAEKFYGEADPTFTGTVDGLVNNGDLGVVSYSRTNATVNTVGTYDDVLTANYTANDNYTVTVNPGDFKIKKKAVTITVADAEKFYGEADPTFTGTVDGLVNNGDLGVVSYSRTNATVNTVGTYDDVLTATYTANDNYTVTVNPGDFEIKKATLTVTTENKEKTYGASDPTLTATVTGMTNGDTEEAVRALLSLNITRAQAGTAAGENVGEYQISATGSELANYNVTYNNTGKLTIKKAALTVTTDNKEKTYGTTDPELTATVTGMTNGDTEAAVRALLSLNITRAQAGTAAGENVGEYQISATGSELANYDVTYNNTGKLTIKKASIAMTCSDAGKTYDGTPITHTISASVPTGDVVTVEYSTDNTTWSTDAPSFTDADTLLVHVRATADNYDTATCDYNLMVNRRYVKIITHGGIHLYDGNPYNVPNNYTIEGDGFVDGEVVNIQTPATVTDLGTCVTDTVTYQTTAAFNEINYTIEYQFGQLCISGNAPIVISSAGNDTPIYYDGQLHGTEPEYRTYTVTYDGVAMPTVEGSNGLKFLLPAGDTVTITPDFNGLTFFDQNSDSNNKFTYTITHNDFYVGPRTVNYGTVNITKRPITFTIDPSMASKPYDGTIMKVNASDLTIGGQGIASTDNLTAGVVKTENYVVGEYTCAEGGFQAGIDGVAIKQGFEIKHSSGHVSTSSYTPVFDVTLTIDAITNFKCPEALTVTIPDGVTQTTLTESELGVPTLTGGDPIPSYVTASSNIAELTLTIGEATDVTWTFYDDNDYAMSTCTQQVTLNYVPCVGVDNYYGHDYEAVRIGSQCWFTENLRADIGTDHHSYKDNGDNLTKFGYLYSWYTAMGVAEGNVNAVPTPALTADNGTQYFQGICPAGWAVPSMSDIAELSNYVGTTSLLKDPSTLYWLPGYEGDTEGNTHFNARGGGRYNAALDRYEDLMTGFHFWAADATPGSISILSACIAYHCDTVILTEPNQKNDRKSVRCIRKHVE